MTKTNQPKTTAVNKEFKSIVKMMKTNHIKRYEDGNGLVIELSEVDFARPKPPRKVKKTYEDLSFDAPKTLKQVFDESDAFAEWQFGGSMTQEVD